MAPDLTDLLSAWLGRDIEPARREELLERLRSDVQFRREFVAEIRMLGMLKTVQSPESRWLRLEDELGWSAADSRSGDLLEDRIQRQLEARPRPRGMFKWWAVAAAVIVIGGAVVALMRRDQTPKVPATASRALPNADAKSGLAMVVKLDGVAAESPDEPIPAVGTILGARRLRFRTGRAVISMLTGVVIDIKGPADLELIDADRVLCRLGTLRARVPGGAEGFRVLGPSWAVVDLGTDFVLHVGGNGKTRGQVLEGQVEAASLNATGAPERTFVLNAAQANSSKGFEIDSTSGRIEAIPTPERFVPASDPISPPLALNAEYPASILRSHPWGYWRFESLEGGLVPNEVASRPPLRATGPVSLHGAPSGNHWAEFRATKGRQFLSPDDSWHPPWESGFAVELWCLTEAIGHSSLVSLLTPKDTDHHVFLMELTARTRLTIHQPASVRLLHRWPAGWEAGDNTYSQEPYVPYRWQHIVGQIHGDRMELYLNGRLSSSLSILSKHADVPCRFVLGRLTEREGTGISYDRPFLGRLDEVALYNHPLSADAIREHYEIGSAFARLN
jgi:hypothetical protein